MSFAHKSLITASILPLLLLGASLHATDFNWNAALDGDWPDAANWSPEAIPHSLSDDVTISATGAPYQVLIAGANVGGTNYHTYVVRNLNLDSADATLAIPSSGALEIYGNFTMNAGVLANYMGPVSVKQGAFHFNGGSMGTNGSISATVGIHGGDLIVGAGAGAGRIQFTGSGNTTSGNIASGQRIALSGLPQNDAFVTASSGFSNAGELRFDGGNSALTLTSGVLNNTGTVSVSGLAFLTGNFENNGSVAISGNLIFNKSGGTYTNNSSLTLNGAGFPALAIVSGATFIQQAGVLDTSTNTIQVEQGGSFIYSGGQINGAYNPFENTSPGRMQVVGGNLTLGAGATGGLGVIMAGSGNTFSGNISASQRIDIYTNSNPYPGQTHKSLVTSSNGFTNAGQINFHPSGVHEARLTINTGALSNTGSFNFNGSGTGAVFEGDLINGGVVRVENNTNTFFDKTNGDYLNNADFTIIGKLVVRNSGSLWNGTTGTLRGTGTVEIEAGSSFTNAGTIAPGLSPGTLTIMGDVPFENTASLEIELGGISNYDLLHVLGGDVFLDGMLEIALINGFTPGYNDIFTILMADSITGAFDNISGNTVILPGGSFEVVQSANQLQLIHYVPEPASGLLMLLGSTAFALRRQRQKETGAEHFRQLTGGKA